jgi:hypothetical protein
VGLAPPEVPPLITEPVPEPEPEPACPEEEEEADKAKDDVEAVNSARAFRERWTAACT